MSAEGGAADGAKRLGGEGHARPARAGAPARWSRVHISAGVGLFALGVALPLLRQSGAHSWDTVWAEDGPVYMADITNSGTRSVMLRGYAGYLQLAPRLLVLGYRLVPVENISVYLALTGSTFSALLALFTYRSTRGWIASWPPRLVVASTVVLAPALIYENVANLTNAIWILYGVLPWALVATNERRADVAARSGVVFLAAASTVLAALFLPLAIGIAWWRRTWAAYVVVGSYVVGLALQAAVVRVASDVTPKHTSSISTMAQLYPLRVLGSSLVGERPLGWLWGAPRVLLAVAFGGAVVGLLAVLAWRASRRARAVAGVMATYAVLAYVVPVWVRGTSIFTLEPDVAGQSGRFVFLPVLMLTSAVAVLIDAPDPSRERSVARVARPLFVAHAAIVFAISFSMPNARSDGPLWIEGIERARVDCASGADFVEIPISPPPWSARIGCDRFVS